MSRDMRKHLSGAGIEKLRAEPEVYIDITLYIRNGSNWLTIAQVRAFAYGGIDLDREVIRHYN